MFFVILKRFQLFLIVLFFKKKNSYTEAVSGTASMQSHRTPANGIQFFNLNNINCFFRKINILFSNSIAGRFTFSYC